MLYKINYIVKKYKNLMIQKKKLQIKYKHNFHWKIIKYKHNLTNNG